MNTTSHKATARRFLEHAAAGRARAESSKLVTPDFRHHNAWFKGDGESLFAGMDDNARQFPDKRLDIVFDLEDGDRVATFCKVRHTPDGAEYAVTHLFRFEGDRIAEMWDMGQEIPKDSPNQHGAF